jgi:hypothetical protein
MASPSSQRSVARPTKRAKLMTLLQVQNIEQGTGRSAAERLERNTRVPPSATSLMQRVQGALVHKKVGREGSPELQDAANQSGSNPETRS